MIGDVPYRLVCTINSTVYAGEAHDHLDITGRAEETLPVVRGELHGTPTRPRAHHLVPPANRSVPDCPHLLYPLLRAPHAHTVWHRSLHHQGRNKFLCGGRVMLGSDANHFWVTIVVTTIPIAVFISLVYVFECQWSERGWQNGGRCARARVCMCVCVCGCVCCMRYVRERVYMCGIRVALSSPHIFSST